MRRGVLPTILTAFALAACANMQSPPANPQAVIDERVAIMKGFVVALTATGQFAQGNGTAAAARAKLSAARTGTDRLESLFPPGTSLGDRGVAKSRALSTIFAKRDDFDAKREALAGAFAALDAAVSQNAKAEATKQLSTTKAACQSCHAKYRTADD